MIEECGEFVSGRQYRILLEIVKDDRSEIYSPDKRVDTRTSEISFISPGSTGNLNVTDAFEIVLNELMILCSVVTIPERVLTCCICIASQNRGPIPIGMRTIRLFFSSLFGLPA